MLKVLASILIYLGLFSASYQYINNQYKKLSEPETKIVYDRDYEVDYEWPSSDEAETRSIEDSNITTKEVVLKDVPNQKVLTGGTHSYQTFNNCGPASLSMTLSYFDINVSQAVLGQELRPYQIPSGDNDDKSVSVAELAEKSKDYGFVPFHRPNGNIEIIKYAITYDIPVIVRTWVGVNDDTGHYRVIKGFNDSQGIIIQDDSLQGKNIAFKYSELNQIWKKFNYEYLLLVPEDKVPEITKVLGENADEHKSWLIATGRAKEQINENPNDIDARFNLIVALTNTEQYAQAIEEFEKIEGDIELKRLWYQMEPIVAYYKIGDYDRVLSLSEQIINNNNRAYSELYILRGRIYEERGDEQKASEEFDKAILYNENIDLSMEF